MQTCMYNCKIQNSSVLQADQYFSQRGTDKEPGIFAHGGGQLCQKGDVLGHVQVNAWTLRA